MIKKASMRLFLRSHKTVIVVVSCVVLLWCGAFSLTYSHFERSIASRESSNRKIEKEAEQLAEQIEAKKLAELAAENQRNEKKALEAEAARQVAEEKAQPAATPHQSASGSASSCNGSSVHSNPASIDVLVNKKHCLTPLAFTPADLITTHGATISAKAAGDFNRMYADAAAAGQPFSVSSSYRSYATQVSTYDYWVSVNGQQGADTVSARPGYSEHQTGLAVDVGANGCNLNCFGGTSQYQWFQANAANYGFIQRYYAGYEAITGYASEEWHYRYVGVAVAQDLKARGIKTLEQYWGLDGGTYR